MPHNMRHGQIDVLPSYILSKLGESAEFVIWFVEELQVFVETYGTNAS